MLNGYKVFRLGGSEFEKVNIDDLVINFFNEFLSFYGLEVSKIVNKMISLS